MMSNKQSQSQTKEIMEYVKQENARNDVSFDMVLKKFFLDSTITLIDPKRLMCNAFSRLLLACTQVVIWSKTYCGYCARTKRLVSSMPDVNTKVIELDQNENGNAIQEALFEMTGQYTVPSVFVSGVHLGGSDDTHSAYASGRLQSMLKA